MNNAVYINLTEVIDQYKKKASAYDYYFDDAALYPHCGTIANCLINNYDYIKRVYFHPNTRIRVVYIKRPYLW